MLFEEIKPFVRFSRKLEFTKELIFPQYFPVDARLFYVINGELNLEINQETLCIKEGNIIYINAGTIYRILQSRVSFYALNFDFTQNFSHLYSPISPLNVSVASKLRCLEKVEFEDTVYFNSYIIFENFHLLKKIFAEINDEYKEKLSFSRQKCSNLTESILITLARNAEKRPSKNSRYEIEKIIKYIQENFNKEINNTTLSEIFHYHPNYISSEFKRVTGKSVHQYLLETRIMHSVKLMESGNRNISEIATFSGFNDSNYFSRYFKATIGITPKKYINNCN